MSVMLKKALTVKHVFFILEIYDFASLRKNLKSSFVVGVLRFLPNSIIR